MNPNESRERLLALCALRDDQESVDWSLLAREAERPGGLDRLLEGKIIEKSAAAEKARPQLQRMMRLLDEAMERVQIELEAAASVNARLVTVLDDDYPTNLRLIHNRPPFLFMLGRPIDSVDLKSVCVVGTRKASAEGVDRARLMARQLVEAGVTVVSGLAAGIDTAAHTETLDVGGRTIAVIGTGVTRTFPSENKALSQRIAENGTIVSQFWPRTSPAKWTFPRRNVVMSGIAQGTVVIEASSTSGAKLQARLAYEHGKRVFLVRTLVTNQPWAKKYVQDGKATEVAKVSDVIEALAEPERIQEKTDSRQLALDLP